MNKFKEACIGKNVCEFSDLKSLFEPNGKCIKDNIFQKNNFFLQVFCGKD